jgi:hypothetical protein
MWSKHVPLINGPVSCHDPQVGEDPRSHGLVVCMGI